MHRCSSICRWEFPRINIFFSVVLSYHIQDAGLVVETQLMESKTIALILPAKIPHHSSRLYWFPTDAEFATTNGWPSGWQTPNTQISAVQARLPSTNTPSADGVRYLDQSYTVVSQMLAAQGYAATEINTNRNQKNVRYPSSFVPILEFEI